MNIIECKNLKHSYGKKVIHNGLNFTLKSGEIVGLLGKNGVGKSTLINILMGYLKTQSGEIKIFGESSNRLSAKTREKIGLLFENYVTYDYLKIKELYKIYKYSYKNRFEDEKFFSLFEKLGVSLDQKINTLSCGQKSQVILGLIFASNPELLILDDYSIGLDTGYRRLFIDYLKEFIKDKNRSVLMTTHIVSDLESLLDSLIILKKDGENLLIDKDKFIDEFCGYKVHKNSDLSEINGMTSQYLIDDFRYIYGFLKGLPKEAKKLNLSFEDAYLGYVGRY